MEEMDMTVTVTVKPGGFEEFCFTLPTGTLNAQQVEAGLQYAHYGRPQICSQAIGGLLAAYIKSGEDFLDDRSILGLVEIMEYFANLWQAEKGHFRPIWQKGQE